MSDKIKICALTTVSTAMDWFVVDSMKNLAKNGFEVTLVCDMDEDFINRNSDYAKCIPVKMSRGVDFIGALKGIWAFYKIFKKNKFDMIQFSTPNAALYASIAGKLAGVPIRVYNQWGFRYITFKGIKRFIFKSLEKLTFIYSTHIRSVSFKNRLFAIEEKLCKESKISVIGIGGTIGVDLNEFDISKKQELRDEIRKEFNLSSEDFVFGYVGRLNVDKGINELIEAFKGIDNAKLMLVGGTEDKYGPSEESWKYINESENVILTGYINPGNVNKYLSAFDIQVHPTYREGFGKVLQEGMALGCPIITTDVLGASEVIENDISGILVPAQDSEALKNEMISLMNDSSRRERYSSAGRKRVEDYFERSHMLSNILEEYKKILSEKTKK